LSLDSLALFLYAVCPILAAVGCLTFSRGKSFASAINVSYSSVSLLLLLLIAKNTTTGTRQLLSYPIVEAAKIVLSLNVSVISVSFLIMLELVFAYFFFRYVIFSPPTRLQLALMYICKAIVFFILLSTNFLMVGVLQVLAAAAFAFLLRFSFSEKSNEKENIRTAVSFFVVQASSGILFFTWAASVGGLGEPSSADLLSFFGAPLWASLFLALPFAPFLVWYEKIVKAAPPAVSVLIGFFVFAILFRHLQIGSTVFHDQGTQIIWPLIAYGLLLGVGAVLSGFLSKDPMILYSAVPQFHIGISIFSYGLLEKMAFASGMALCGLSPLVLALALSFGCLGALDRRQRPLAVGFLILMLGFPGTPLFGIWGLIGQSVLHAGNLLILLACILWVLLLAIGVLFFRRTREVFFSVEGKLNVSRSVVLIDSTFLIILMAATWYLIGSGVTDV
jgi:hypothetical protein